MLHIEVDIIFNKADGRDMHPAGSDTFSLTITMSANVGPSLTGVVNTPSPMVAHIPVAEGSAVRLTVPSNTETMQLTSFPAHAFPSSQRGDLPIESGTPDRPVADRSLNESETSRATLSRAEEAINTMNTIKTWSSAVNVIKRVMDTVSPIAAV
jgi:hypothetical protein